MQAAAPDALTINEAAATTGWSARMLRYVERIGLVSSTRSAAGYRLYGPAELQRLRTLRELLGRFEVGLAEIGFALRLRREPELKVAVDDWLATEPARPEHVAAADWLRFEQEKHQRLLAVATPSPATSSTRTMEAA
ncbi:MAG TPA: MerR family transcriptional regulator [Solirubrobacteraceae bacterium]|jgi:MerR family copper efflux transcriptional regulator|nr:MerR family transcriptional regulator [Solirubrobacteraceae bacterium]